MRYVIDATDHLRELSPNWNRFAAENGAPNLSAEALVGRSLWEFVGDAETVALYRLLLERARTGAQVSFPLRCDSPTERRFLQMSLFGRPDGSVEIVSETRRCEIREALALNNYLTAESNSETLMVCSWCEKVSTAAGWQEIEAAVTTLRLFDGPPPTGISHGICPTCSVAVRVEAGLGAATPTPSAPRST